MNAPHAQDSGRFAAKHNLGKVFRMVGGYQWGPRQCKHKFAVPADAAYTYKYLRGPKAKPTLDPGMVFHYLMAKDGHAMSAATDIVKPKHGSPKDLEGPSLRNTIPKRERKGAKGQARGQNIKWGWPCGRKTA